MGSGMLPRLKYRTGHPTARCSWGLGAGHGPSSRNPPPLVTRPGCSFPPASVGIKGSHGGVHALYTLHAAPPPPQLKRLEWELELGGG